MRREKEAERNTEVSEMEVWYYIVENGKRKRVSYEVYEEYNGEKYCDAPPLNKGAKFLNDLLMYYR